MDLKDTPNKPFLTTKQASQLMGLTEEEVRSRCRNGELVGAWQTQDDKGHWQIPRGSVNVWMLSHKPRHDLTGRFKKHWTWLKNHPWLAVPLAMIPVVVYLLSVLADITGVASTFGVELVRPKAIVIPMEGDYNVAVAGFQVSGTGSGLESATEMANNIGNAIHRELSSLEQEMDQRIEIRLPGQVGVVTGNSEEKRAEQASALARAINAHMVIYGVVEVDGALARITPEFYVRSDGFSEAAEITGQYRIGSPVSIEKVENVVLRREASRLIEKRFRALTFVIYGLADQAVGNYTSALEYLHKALETMAWDNPDVLYVLLGNSALKLGDFEQASDYYQASLTVNVAYARAYVGLGSTYYMAALGDVSSDTYDSVDLRLLDQAIAFFEQALDTGIERPPLADVPAKAHLALGQSYLLKAETSGAQGDNQSQDSYNAMAAQAFRAVIEYYADGQNQRIQELAAHAHAHLGMIHFLNGEYQPAITEYQRSVALLPPLGVNLERKALYEAAVAQIYVSLEQPVQAIEWYQRAISDSPPNSEQQSQYRTEQEALR